MRRRLWATAVALISFPIMGLADVTGSPTLAVGTMLNLDTGATGSSGGDLLWNGTSLAPQAGAGTFALGSGMAAYNALTQSIVSGIPTNSNPITGSALAVNNVFVYKTKSGNFGKMILTTVTVGGSLGLQFTTFVAAVPTGPNITAVQNNYGQVPQGLPNYGIAPSTLIFIQGTGLAGTTTDLQSSASPGLVTTLDNVTVKVTVGGTTVQCPLYYLSPTQIDAVLPGNTPLGTGTLTVTNNGATSPAASINVVQSAFGILFYNGSLGAAYDGNNNILTTANSANPGQTIVLWGSGVGADPNDDDKVFPQKQDNLTNIPMQAYVGGVQATIAYRGRSQYPGVDQVVLTIPGNVPTGCNVSVAVVSGNIVSNSVTIPITATGRTCTDTNGIGTSGLNGQTVREGFLAISRSNSIQNGASTVTNTVGGSFFSITNFGSTGGAVSSGSCLFTNSLQTASVVEAPLDAGAGITVTGPAGSVTLTSTIAGQSLPGLYGTSAAVPASFIPAAGGSFTFDNGSGGKDVQHFNSTLNVAPAFNWTNQAQITAVTRAQGVNVTWSGGAPGSIVGISGSSSATINGKFVSVSFTCEAPIGDGQFTVPVPVLLALPAGSGTLSVGDSGNFQQFSATGLDIGFLFSSDSTSKSMTYN
jgi:uncharacterized protein (TIGR03437 family)